VLYKKVRVLIGKPPTLADVTAGTSQATKKMFAEAFGVSEDSVYVSGYPRNDMLLEAKANKDQLKNKINDLSTFQKIAIWMPTFRKHRSGFYQDGVEVGNPFYIENFKIARFNDLLAQNNALCLMKPHPFAPKYEDYHHLSNIRFIDDKWITGRNLTLYELLGCTDLLISDVSSVIIDYLLLDQPVICVCTDFEEYRETRGFYFDDIENWLPSRINKTQDNFFEHLEQTLKNEPDPFRQKRERLKKYFFDYYDSRSTERLVKHVLETKGKVSA
jgi:CDP-glycerol glycerophosphotransferase (TagB/SpsB family)